MSATRAALRLIVQQNLTSRGVTSNFYADDEINNSLTDAYNEVVAKSKCNVKKSTQNWLSGWNYYDPIVDLSLTDYLGPIGLFDHNSNLWLRDDVTIRDFNRIRRDWETWVGYSQFWTPHSQRFIAVCPALKVGVGTFDFWYYAVAPTLTGDGSTTILPTDMDQLLTDYVTDDLLSSDKEFTKSITYLQRYMTKLVQFKERCHNLAKHQMLLRI